MSLAYLAKVGAKMMKCETKINGLSCTREAVYIVSGLRVSKHPTCEYHSRAWLATRSPDNPVFLIPIEAEKSK